MKSPHRLLAALLAPLMLAFAAVADAQNCTNGNTIYHRKLAGVDISCSQSSCHDTDPKSNKNNIQNGAQQPAKIDAALDGGVSDMSGLRASLGLTPSDIDDLALYIWYRQGNQQCPAAAPVVGASPSSLAFGSVNVGSSSSAQTVTLSNTGGAAANSLVIGTAPAGYARTTTCGASLAAGGSCTISVTFSPTAAQAYGGSISVTGTGGTNISIGLSGTGAAAASSNVNASSSFLSFGNVTVGQTSGSQTITVSNTGTAAATNMSYPAAPAKYNKSGTCASATLNAGASCTIVFSYTPTAVGTDNATYTFTGGGKTFPIALSGAGTSTTPPPAGQLSMTSAVSMPSTTVGTTSAAQTVTISNTGGSAVTVSSITSSNAGEFTVSGSNCGTVNAGGGCTFNLTFTPAAAGARSATVTVVSNGTGSPQSIAASGTGVAQGGGGLPPTAVAVEYYHAAFDHYFVTAITDEITKLDNGTFVGWQRTSLQFDVYKEPTPGASPVCRFFSNAFGEKSSHFYTASPAECEVVKTNPSWSFEGEVFYVATPATDGTCATGLAPVYRMYNNGMGAAPNHRLTIDSGLQAEMETMGWIPEGYGVGVTMCVPAPAQ